MPESILHLDPRQRIGQLFSIGIAGPEIDSATEKLLREIQPGGVCLFARNIREASQVRDLCTGLREILIDPIISIDQEGGTVDRLRRIVTPLAAAGQVSTPADAEKMGGIVGELLRILGVNTDFAPVVDVVDAERRGASNGLFTRPFGNSKESVVELAGGFLDGLEKSGIRGCLKHFPGLGAAKVDSHNELPNIDMSDEELYAVDLYPYRELLPEHNVAVMVAHAAYSGVSLQEKAQNGTLLPSSLSGSFIAGLLREKIGFDGMVFTDDLEMGAILRGYGIGEACRMAFAAGADALCICAEAENVRAGFAAIEDAAASGEITEARLDESLQRISRAKNDLAEPLPFDEARIAELSEEISVFNASL
ncbi:MAG TPA: glycoside hydrolase family 3 N-terminal domain-containing protein [Pyrinomonadaceae bacterium]|nr:glycoside hydrolase family 3 N-terminal domain-containing protein [Pyrinomonadaceae bacterium]